MVTASAAVRRAADQRRALGLNQPGILVPAAGDWGTEPRAHAIDPLAEGDTRGSGDWIQTHTGRMFHVTDPLPSEFNIEDIATALSNICRFGGHVRRFYSVAQHCVEVASECPKEFRLEGLLHDAAEAYIGDMVRPLKHSSGLAGYREIEVRVEMALVQSLPSLGIRYPWPAEVHRADNVLLLTEHRDLQVASPAPWGVPAVPLERTIVPMTPREARSAWFRTYAELAAGRRPW